MSNQTESNPDIFEAKKKAYFIKIGYHLSEGIRQHQIEGLLKKDESGKREWGNVPEHCLVEAARVRIFANKLYLPGDLSDDLMMSAVLHDYYKMSEREIVEKEGMTWDSFEKSNNCSSEILRDAHFKERVVRLFGAMGHGSFIETEQILNKENLSPDDIAYLIMHYVDEYTVNNEWAQPTEGNKNELIRRIEKNESNPRYAQLNIDGKKHLGGRTTYQAQHEIGLRTEQRLANLLNEKVFRVPNALDLPMLIDNEIKNEILSA